MADVDMEKLRAAALEIIAKVVKEGMLEEFTHGSFRKKVEQSMGVDAGTLDASEYRRTVRKIAEDYIEKHTSGNKEDEDAPMEEAEDAKEQEKPNSKPPPSKTEKTKSRKPRSSTTKGASERKSASKGKKPARSSSVVPTSDEEAEPKAKPKSRKKTSRVQSDPEASDAGSSPEPPAKRQKTGSPLREKEEQDAEPSGSAAPQASSSSPKAKQASTSKEGAASEGEKSESEMSVLEDEPAPRRRKKKADGGAFTKAEKGTKGRKRKEGAKELSKDDETIKRLKSLVVACGVRKVWSKEFKGLDKPSDQIRRLRQILSDLGMKGRMSMEQAKVIREKREFEQELEDVKEFAQKMESANRRRSAKSVAAEQEDVDESDVDIPPKRRMTARQSIMAFLGDEESD
ncbi:hypothetical protein L226DRAFT_536488 [Lentinus tigrinus ALCF2SS1-7]|uniref:Uncharacterized protein n=1 Tax=Lentinus tigrinus ALCF2SS1-6 TaxID=1328759 RepID=A0A5C2S5C0_9APHY|nr:hypothetical protein L227DRAFT_576588 [Lentinus tigrinus ALCF2SS1-6]RPD73371.1 hypothetical protein L226DRAFT_536488 [Lentinus tigrinus ALCF2SS1-7]